MKHGEKKRFVLGQASSVSAAEVVKRARAAGIKLSTGYVYILRSQSNRAAPKAGKVAEKRTDSATALVASAAEIGLRRAYELMSSLRQQAAR